MGGIVHARCNQLDSGIWGRPVGMADITGGRLKTTPTYNRIRALRIFRCVTPSLLNFINYSNGRITLLHYYLLTVFVPMYEP